MFHFFNRKPYLKDLIPDQHVDFHSHLLPGIDDGAKTDENTIALVTDLQQLGFGEMIATPHVMKSVWENSRETIEQKLSETNAMLEKNNISLTLRAGAEYLVDGNFAELFQNEKLLTLKDNYVLVEMSYVNPPIQLYAILFDLQVAGYTPILAHPERYSFYHQNFGEYHRLKHSGCLFQLNLLSLVGYYGKSVAETAKKLLENGLVDFVGSDVHHQNHIAAFSKRILFKDTLPLKEAFANNGIFKY